MSTLRSNVMGVGSNLSPDLLQTLRRNGMQAELVRAAGGMKLYVQSHDSPVYTYDVSEKQFVALCDGGTNYTDKLAYNTFVNIVKKDFDCPKDWIHARNANGSVAMGLHGYRQDVGLYSRVRPMRGGFWTMQNPYFLGWTPRHQPGYHGRRIDGRYAFASPAMIPVRAHNQMRPGELTSGGYGFYHNPSRTPQPQQQDVMQQLADIKVETDAPKRSTEPAVPYSELWGNSQVTNAFTSVKFKECLDSHGILIDADKKTLTIQSNGVPFDKTYQLSDDEYRQLMSNRIDKVSLQQRVDIINKVISEDYSKPLTVAMLDSKERISIPLKDEVKNDLNLRQEAALRTDVNYQKPVTHGTASVDGAALSEINEAKGWFREGKHGREVTVGEIWVEPVREKLYDSIVMKTSDGHYNMVAELSAQELAALDRKETTVKELAEKHMGRPLAEGDDVVRVPGGMLTKDEKTGEVRYNETPSDIPQKFQMSAVINGEVVTHEISEKDYAKFVSMDDYHRMKLFSKNFGEVDMKTLPEMRMNFFQGLGMAFEVIRGLSGAAVDVAHGIGAIRHATHDHHPHHPDDIADGRPIGGVYFKPGVDDPQALAERAFNEGMRVNEIQHRGMGI